MTRGVRLLLEAGQRVPHPRTLSRLAAQVARSEKLTGDVNLVFCSDEKIRELNRKFRGLNRITDVLSFSWEEPDFAGEVYIANPQALRQASRWNNSYFNELRRLSVHGMLHLCGYDHVKPRDRAKMRHAEEKYLKNR